MTQGIGSALAELLLALDMDARTLCLAASHRRRARERRRAHEAWRPAAALLCRPIGAWDAVLGRSSRIRIYLVSHSGRAASAAAGCASAAAGTGSALGLGSCWRWMWTPSRFARQLASGGGRGTGGARGLEACGGSAVPAHRRLGCGAWRDCERFLVKHFDLSVDFAVEDALPRLEQWGLVRRLVQKGPGKLKFEAVHVETAALALQEIWQKSFAALAAPPETATFPLSNLISGQERAPATNQDSLFRAATSGATATAAEQDAAAAAAGPAASAAAAAPATPPLKPSSSTATSAAAAKTSSGGGGGGGGGGGLFSFCDWLVATRVLLVGGFSHISGRSGGVGGGGRGRGFFFTGAPPGACVPDAWPGAETREGRAAGGSSDGSALPGLQECRWGVPYATISHGLLDAICKRVGCKGAFCEDPGGGKRGVLQLLAKRRQAECMEDECPTD
ncbi:hypothetical protein PLESTF_001335500 [Pleodorina starrii]|nr:hypothetical protein PLESTF_001335500 [Pleodorina starrii]